MKIYELPKPPADPRENDVWNVNLKYPITDLECLFYWKEDIPVYEERYIKEEGREMMVQVGTRAGWMCTPFLPDFPYNEEEKMFLYTTTRK